jgi:nicotinamidase-related amidase
MKKLLIVVDYQVDFVNGALGFPKAMFLEDKIVNKIKEFENNGDDVIFTLDTHYENYLSTDEGANLPIPHCIKNTYGHELYGDVKKMSEGHLCFEKNTFGSSKLFEWIKDKEYEEVYLCGVVTNICVISNAVVCKAALPNAKIKVIKDLVGSNDDMLEEKCFAVMNGLHIEIC